jgi:biotin carboxylase
LLTVALYTAADRDSLHVRLADEVMQLHSLPRYGDADEVLAIAKATGADAIHPGYGFLAEEAGFASAAQLRASPSSAKPPAVTALVRNKMEAMDTVKHAGYRVPLYAELTPWRPGNWTKPRWCSAPKKWASAGGQVRPRRPRARRARRDARRAAARSRATPPATKRS